MKDVKKKFLKRLPALELGIATADLTLSVLRYAMPYTTAPQSGMAKRVESRRYFEIAKPLAKIALRVRLPELVGRG